MYKLQYINNYTIYICNIKIPYIEPIYILFVKYTNIYDTQPKNKSTPLFL